MVTVSVLQFTTLLKKDVKNSCKAHWIFISCRHPLHQRTSTAVCRRYSTLMLIMSATTEPVKNGAYLVRYLMQPPEDNRFWSLSADQRPHCYQWQASSSWPGCPVGLRVNN